MRKFILLGVIVLGMMSFTQDTSVITKEDGVSVVNTTTLCKGVKGYIGTTPLKIYIKDGKIQRIKALRNKETAQYFLLIKKQLFPKYEGMSVNKAAKTSVDAVTGATLSSKAVMKNIQNGCEYYNKTNKS